MDLKKLSEPLRADQIEFRVQSINKGGYATVLAYKDARADMQRLDDVVGPLGWKREHYRDNHNCIVSLYDKVTGQWIGKDDTGTESNTEAQKGLASDSFKRACFNWGIGRELYDYPIISIKLNKDEFTVDGNRAKQTWNLQLKQWKWKTLFSGNQLVAIEAIDNNGNVRYKWRSDQHDQFLTKLAQYKKLYREKDSEGLFMLNNELSQEEELYDVIWRALSAAERREIKELISEETKEQKSNE